MTTQEALKPVGARKLRLKQGEQCVLEYDVHGNRHSSDCPCYDLANQLLKKFSTDLMLDIK